MLSEWTDSAAAGLILVVPSLTLVGSSVLSCLDTDRGRAFELALLVDLLYRSLAVMGTLMSEVIDTGLPDIEMTTRLWEYLNGNVSIDADACYLLLRQTHRLENISTGNVYVSMFWDVGYLTYGDGNSYTALGASQWTCRVFQRLPTLMLV